MEKPLLEQTTEQLERRRDHLLHHERLLRHSEERKQEILREITHISFELMQREIPFIHPIDGMEQ